MTKFSLCIFTVAVLLGGAASNYICIAYYVKDVIPDNFFTDEVAACQNVKMKFNNVRKELKKCTRFAIDTSLMESLHNDFCTEGSDYRQKFKRNEECLKKNIFKGKICMNNLSTRYFNPRDLRTKSLEEVCTSLTQKSLQCMIDKVGAPCGQEAKEVYKRMAKSVESVTKGTCLDAGSSSTHSVASNAVIFCCILLGLLFTQKYKQ